MSQNSSQSLHLALYRKYRPSSFETVRGQEHVVNVLKGALSSGSIPHAFLFAGGRGTGKTTIARIFAKELGTDESDIYEIDAASNRGIDDIRELRDAVHVLPFISKYKVYIVDEVHMLTKEAFNALLKTLEEPPQHVIFMLATTEIDKLPETVVSRCQTFIFKKPSQAQLREMILEVAKQEGFELEPDAAELIAILGDGSYRDTHGNLQKVLQNASANGKAKVIKASDVEAITGAPRGELIHSFIHALSERNTADAISALSQAVDGGADIQVFLSLTLAKIRTILLIKVSPVLKAKFVKEISEEEMKFIEAHTKGGITSEVLAELLMAHSMMKTMSSSLPIELAVMKLAKKE